MSEGSKDVMISVGEADDGCFALRMENVEVFVDDEGVEIHFGTMSRESVIATQAVLNDVFTQWLYQDLNN